MLPRDVGIPGWEVHPGELSCVNPYGWIPECLQNISVYSNKRGVFILYGNNIVVSFPQMTSRVVLKRHINYYT